MEPDGVWWHFPAQLTKAHGGCAGGMIDAARKDD
jgi:hypothetical protein